LPVPALSTLPLLSDLRKQAAAAASKASSSSADSDDDEDEDDSDVAAKHIRVWRVCAKAVDSAYNTQPEKVASVWNLRGVISNHVHCTNVHISAPAAAQSSD